MSQPTVVFEELTWGQIRDKTFIAEPELCQIIDEIAPGKNLPLLKFSYSYGSLIVDDGMLFLPTSDAKTVPLTHDIVSSKIREQLAYQPLPLALVSGSGGVEVYSELEDRVFSLAYFEQGLNLGIWEALESSPTPCRVSAGARSILVLPKMTDTAGYKRFKQDFGVRSPMPSTPFAQWYLFSELAKHPDFPEPWSCEIIFFTDKWMEKICNDKVWVKFYNFILKRAWKHTEYVRKKLILDTVWESFSRLLTQQRIKPNSYIVDILKHLVFVAIGALPAFTPCINSQSAPIDGLLKLLFDVYGSKKYYPSMMYTNYFQKDNDDPVYYTLQIPTYLESIPKFRNPNSARVDLTILIELMDQFIIHLMGHQQFSESKREIKNFFSDIEFNYFHSESMKDAGIHSSSDMPHEDTRFLYLPVGYTQDLVFCEKSNFTRGCVWRTAR